MAVSGYFEWRKIMGQGGRLGFFFFCGPFERQRPRARWGGFGARHRPDTRWDLPILTRIGRYGGRSGRSERSPEGVKFGKFWRAAPRGTHVLKILVTHGL